MFQNCYQDFPFPDGTVAVANSAMKLTMSDVPDYPSADDIVKYLKAYVDRFDLRKSFRFGFRTERLERSADGTQWTIKLKDRTGQYMTQDFDKVIVATGPYQSPFIPTVPGSGNFQGKILHSQAFKE